MRLLPLLLFAAGCGGARGYVLLEVSGDVAVPAEANSLEVRTSQFDTGKELVHLELRLDSEHALPIDVLLEADEDTPESLELRATLRHDGTAVAAGIAPAVWQEDKVVRVRLRLQRVSP